MSVDICVATGEIFLFDDINEESALLVVKAISELNNISPAKRLTLVIQTHGGCLFSTMSIISAMANSIKPVDTMGMGNVCSGGFILFVYGEVRYLNAHSTYMWHDCSNFHQGSRKSIKILDDHIDKIMEQVDDIITSKTLLTKEDLRNLYDSNLDKWYTSSEMLELFNKSDIVDEPHNHMGLFDRIRSLFR